MRVGYYELSATVVKIILDNGGGPCFYRAILCTMWSQWKATSALQQDYMLLTLQVPLAKPHFRGMQNYQLQPVCFDTKRSKNSQDGERCYSDFEAHKFCRVKINIKKKKSPPTASLKTYGVMWNV